MLAPLSPAMVERDVGRLSNKLGCLHFLGGTVLEKNYSMARVFLSILYVIATATHKELACQVR